MVYIAKEKSTIIKGIAIMMMLCCHLFDCEHIDMCTSFFFVGNTPLIRWLLPAFGPIPFFMILSGYGLAYKYETGKLGFRGQVPRVLRLYVHYWVILAFFLVVGHMMEPSLYPGKMTKLLRNMIGWNVSYNSAMWFLLPYSILSLLSFYIIRLVERIGNLWAIVITIAIEVCTSFLISRYGDILIEHQFVYQPLLCFHLLQPFTIGIVLRRTSFSLDRSLRQWMVITGIVVLVILECLIEIPLRNIIYVPLMITLLSQVKWGGWLKTILMELGRTSMAIWMIHCWLALHLFEPQFYSLKYVPLIFIATLAASYLVSLPVMWVAGKINKALIK